MVNYQEYMNELKQQSFMDMVDAFDERKETERLKFKKDQSRNMEIYQQKLMNCIEYMISHKCSTKEAAMKFVIQPAVLYKYINNDLRNLSIEKYNLIKAIQNVHVGNSSTEKAERAIIVAEYMLAHNTTVRETAEQLRLTEKQVYRDLTVVLPKIDEEKHIEIKKLFESRKNIKKTKKNNVDDDSSFINQTKETKRAIQIANYIIENQVSIKEVAEEFNLPTFVVVEEIEITLPRCDKEKYEIIKAILG